MTELVRVVSLVALFALPVLLVYRSFLVYKNRLALTRDLDVARIQGRQWRDETRALLKGLGEAIDRQSAVNFLEPGRHRLTAASRCVPSVTSAILAPAPTPASMMSTIS